MAVDLAGVRVGEPLRHRALAVFPLFGAGGGPVDYLLADEALGASSVVVEEVGEEGRVPELLVENKGGTRVLFLEGEPLVGAKQNRVLNTSILIAARGKAKVPVSCVEQGRWAYRSRTFGHGGSHATSSVRRELKRSVSASLASSGDHRADQGAVWREVARQQEALGVESDTMAMADTFDRHVDRLADYRAAFPYVAGASGLAVAIGGAVVAADLFDKPETCRKVWDRLLAGAMLDALEREGSEAAADADAPAVERVLADARAARWDEAPAVGEGRELRAAFGTGHGSALLLGDVAVHVSLVAG